MIMSSIEEETNIGPDDSRNNHAILVCVEAVGNGNHREFTNTITDLTTTEIAKSSLRLA
jgi:hypothetical protein